MVIFLMGFEFVPALGLNRIFIRAIQSVLDRLSRDSSGQFPQRPNLKQIFVGWSI